MKKEIDCLKRGKDQPTLNKLVNEREYINDP